MRAHLNKANKSKASGKAKKKNPYLPDDSDDDGLGDGLDLRAEHTDEYKRTARMLLQRWPCKKHPGKICLGDKSKQVHFEVTHYGELAWVLALVRVLLLLLDSNLFILFTAQQE